MTVGICVCVCVGDFSIVCLEVGGLKHYNNQRQSFRVVSIRNFRCTNDKASSIDKAK